MANARGLKILQRGVLIAVVTLSLTAVVGSASGVLFKPAEVMAAASGDSTNSERSKWVNHSGDKVFEDFEWLRRILYDKEKPGDLFPNGKIVRSKDEIEGEWEAYMTDDPKGTKTVLMDAYIEIDGDDSTLTIKWRKRIMEDSGEVIDMTRDWPFVFHGKLTDDLTHIKLDEEHGYWRSEIRMFFEENGKQYGSASHILKKQDGTEKNVSTIGFTREH